MNKIVAYAMLLRLPGLCAMAMPTVFGAITVGIFDLQTILILFGIGAFSTLYGFILNDLIDIELDSLVNDLQQKPLVSGEISKKIALNICILLILFIFLFLFYLWLGKTLDEYKFLAIICIIIAGILGSTYNLYGKKIAGSDFFVAISMSFLFLFGALAVGVPNYITWIVFILIFLQTLHMNLVEGGIKDADHDYKMGVINVALASGVHVENNTITIPNLFKIISITIHIIFACFLIIPFIIFNYSYNFWQLIILLVGMLGVFYYGIKLILTKIYSRSKIQKYIGIQLVLRYSLVPIMLMSTIGMTYTLILIIIPILWYSIFTILIGERLFQPRM